MQFGCACAGSVRDVPVWELPVWDLPVWDPLSDVLVRDLPVQDQEIV